MTQTNEKAKALKHVREVCGLKIPTALPLPVRLDGYTGGYIWGKENEMIADFDDGVNVGDGFRIRGWGRIQNEELMKENMQFIADSINAYASPHLEHWLRGIGGEHGYWGKNHPPTNLTWKILEVYNLSKDGNNQSPEFYQAYNEIVKV